MSDPRRVTPGHAAQAPLPDLVPADSRLLAGAIVEQVLPTNLGRTVSVVRTPDGTRFLLKTAALDEWRSELHQQARHFELLREWFGEDAPYPRIVELGPDHAVMEFYSGGSLDDLAFHGRAGDLDGLLGQLLETYLSHAFDAQPPPAVEVSAVARLATSFTDDQLRGRIARLEAAVAAVPIMRNSALPAHLRGRYRS